MKEVTVGKPYFLSGGIEPGDVQRLKDFGKSPEGKALFAIDINTKFEAVTGVRNIPLIKDFIQKLK